MLMEPKPYYEQVKEMMDLKLLGYPTNDNLLLALSMLALVDELKDFKLKEQINVSDFYPYDC